MSRPSLISLYAFHLANSLKTDSKADKGTISFILDQILLLFEASPSLFAGQSIQNDLSFLISGICIIFREKTSSRESIAQSLKIINKILDVNTENVLYIYSITPGSVSSLFHLLVVNNNLSIVSSSVSIPAIEAIFRFLKNAFSIPIETILADKKAVIKLENVLGALYSKIRILGSSSKDLVEFFFLSLVNLLVVIPEQLINHWLSFGLNWIANLSESFSNRELLVKYAEILSSCSSISKFVTKMQTESLKATQDLNSDSLRLLLFSVCINSNHKVLEFLYFGLQATRNISMNFNKVLPVITAQNVENLLAFCVDDIFAADCIHFLISQFISFDSVESMLYSGIIDISHQKKISSLVLLNFYASNCEKSQLEPFFEVICDCILLMNDEKLISLSLLFLGRFIEKSPDLKDRIPLFIYSVLLNLGSSSKTVSDLSLNILFLTAQRHGTDSVETMLAEFQGSILSSLAISMRFKRSEIQQVCIVLINLFKFLKGAILPFFNDVALYLLDHLASVHTKKDSQQECFIVLSVLEEYFKVYSEEISFRKSRPQLFEASKNRTFSKSPDSCDLTATESCALKILQLTKNFLFKDDPKLQNIATRLLKSSLPYLSTIGKQFLPMIHEYWDGLVKRLPKCSINTIRASDLFSKASTGIVIETIIIFCQLASDFVADRVCRELIPHMEDFVSYVGADLILRLVYVMISKFERLKDLFVRDLFYFLVGYESNYKVASECITLLSIKYPASMWFYLNCSNESLVVFAPSLSTVKQYKFQTIDFCEFKSKKIPTFSADSADFYLNILMTSGSSKMAD